MIMGNLAPVDILMMKKPEEVRAASLEILRSMDDIPNFGLMSGCDLPIGTPIENIRAMMDAVKEYQTGESPVT
jgi:uroporphyrinogen decarboxylase